jgi:hypothetical protein
VGHPAGLRLSLIEHAQRLADDLLRPHAAEVDRTRVPRSHVDALAEAGLLGLAGLNAPEDEVARQVHELLAGACAATWFVIAQHFTPVKELTASPNEALRARYLDQLVAGSRLAGVAFAHLRRPVPPVTCARAEGGWVFDGRVPWMTAWGLCDVFLLAGRAGDEQVFVLLPAQEAPGLRASEPLPLLAMQATATVTLTLEGLFVPDADVVTVRAHDAWVAADRERTADVTPAAFGLHTEVVRLLEQRAPALSYRLAGEGARLRQRAYALIGDADRYNERLGLRAQSLDLCMRSATALVVATGGSAMELANPAQRHLREAAFLQVQAQTPALRALMLERT